MHAEAELQDWDWGYADRAVDNIIMLMLMLPVLSSLSVSLCAHLCSTEVTPSRTEHRRRPQARFTPA
jgi:hypothetical protein